MQNNFRLVLWIFMTAIVLIMLTITGLNDGPTWKIIALSVFFVIGVVFCFFLYKNSGDNR